MLPYSWRCLQCNEGAVRHHRFPHLQLGGSPFSQQMPIMTAESATT
jgi:hypothetical protein